MAEIALPPIRLAISERAADVPRTFDFSTRLTSLMYRHRLDSVLDGVRDQIKGALSGH